MGLDPNDLGLDPNDLGLDPNDLGLDPNDFKVFQWNIMLTIIFSSFYFHIVTKSFHNVSLCSTKSFHFISKVFNDAMFCLWGHFILF